MSELIEKAVAKIDKQAEKGGALAKALAQYIIDNLICDDEAAIKILDEKKTLSECARDLASAPPFSACLSILSIAFSINSDIVLPSFYRLKYFSISFLASIHE